MSIGINSSYFEPDFYPDFEQYSLKDLKIIQKMLDEAILNAKIKEVQKEIKEKYSIICSIDDVKEYYTESFTTFEILNRILIKVIGKEFPKEFIEEFYIYELPDYMSCIKPIK